MKTIGGVVNTRHKSGLRPIGRSQGIIAHFFYEVVVNLLRSIATRFVQLNHIPVEQFKGGVRIGFQFPFEIGFKGCIVC